MQWLYRLGHSKFFWLSDNYTHTPHTRLTALCPGLPGWAGTNLDFTEARQWHQLGHMQVCTSLQADNHASNPLLVLSQAGCPSCRPINSVKALKDWVIITCIILIHFWQFSLTKIKTAVLVGTLALDQYHANEAITSSLNFYESDASSETQTKHSCRVLLSSFANTTVNPQKWKLTVLQFIQCIWQCINVNQQSYINITLR